MNYSIPFLIFSLFLSFNFCENNDTINNGANRGKAGADENQCPEPETKSQGRLLDIISNCTYFSGAEKSTDPCATLIDCLAENLVQISVENKESCLANQEDTSGGFRAPCSVAATAYVILEQIRRLFLEDTIYKNCPQIQNLLSKTIKECGTDPLYTVYMEKHDLNDLEIQEVLAKFLVQIGRKMQTFDEVKADIAVLERTKHRKALIAMLVSFAVPGLLGLCEAAHFRTGLLLQCLALFVIGGYQFTKYGGYWAAVGVGSCMMIMVVEFGILILIKKKCGYETGEQEKKME